MDKLDSVELWLLKKAVECKMEKLMDFIEETKSEPALQLYGDYAALHKKLDIIYKELPIKIMEWT